MKRNATAPCLGVLLAAALLLNGCGDKRRDTREDVPSIGVVITIEADNTFKEMFVYPGDLADMGEDFIKNTSDYTRVGSFGCTVEAGGNYSVWLKDWDGGAYEFKDVPFQNADHGIITNSDGLLLTLHHTDGSTEEIEGTYILPGDAPSYSQVPLAEQESFKFNLYNDTGHTLSMVSMREAQAPDKGEVQLDLDPLESGDYVTISSKLYEHDFDNHEWLLNVKSEDGGEWLSKASFDPWAVKTLRLSLENGELILDADEEG